MELDGSRKGRTVTILIVIILVLGGLLLYEYSRAASLNRSLQLASDNAPTIRFMKLFVEVILRQDEPVTSDQRYDLEKAVRDIGDKELLDLWNAFASSSGNAGQAERYAVDILSALIDRLEPAL